jgi:hypothetical protein
MDDLFAIDEELLSGSGQLEDVLAEIEATPDFGGDLELEAGGGFGDDLELELQLEDAESALDELEAEASGDFFAEALETAEGPFEDIDDAVFAFADIEAEVAMDECDNGSLMGMLRANPGLKVTLSF